MYMDNAAIAKHSMSRIGLYNLLACAFALILACSMPTAAFADEGSGDASVYVPATIDGLAPDGSAEDAEAEEVGEVGRQPMHRLYNLRSGEHFYTGSDYEFDYLVSIGWFNEGIGWIAPVTSNTPVYRLYNPNAGDHHYTTSEAERDHLVEVGWSYEGVGWYSDDAQTAPLYRQYNPNAVCGAHNFTTSAYEDSALVSVGWHGEGVAWYALGEGESGSMVWFSRDHLQAMADTVIGSGDVTLGYGTSLPAEQIAVINGIIAAEPSITFLAINARTGKCIARLPDSRLFSASTAKAPYIAALCKYEAPGIEGYRDVLYDTITNSSNEAFAYLNSIYGKMYIAMFGNEAGFNIDMPYDPAYANYTPRELAKLWINIRDFIISSSRYSDMYRNLFGRGGIFKEGWMYPWAWCGQIYNLTGIEGDMVYAIMSRAENQSPLVWELRNTLVTLTG